MRKQDGFEWIGQNPIAEALSDGELLAIILRIGNAGQSAEDLGRELLAQCGGLPGLDRTHVEDFLSLPCLGIAKAAQIKAVIEIGKRVRIQEHVPEPSILQPK